MSGAVFVDSGAWIAVWVPRDSLHRRALSTHRQLLGTTRLVTTNLVIAESYVGIHRNRGHGPATEYLRSLRRSPRLAKIYSDETLEAEAEAILARYADQDFSFTDAVSFAVMRQRGIAEAFAFDRHFL
ncbi:MAG: PIN domain-containing protein, partial [Chloroflexi bacterium]|nr:PIN domain-containing protein [Chloroflexota bacterium]